MEEAIASPLVPWESSYVIVGSSAAALTGLQFVVIVLGAEVHTLESGTTRAFGTPTVVHFCAVLLMSAIMSAPWPALTGAAISLAACGVAGVAYAFTVIRHTRRQTGYKPVLEDWVWHAVLPVIAYLTLLVAALLLARRDAAMLFVIGGVAILLLFVGIHNAWDAVTYIAMRDKRPGGP